MTFSCPYCGGELPPPTRKRSCPHCQKIIFARSRPKHPKTWVQEEDLPKIAKEWADKISKEAILNPSINPLHANRDRIRDCVRGGVVKSVQILTGDDELVCPNCQPFHEKVLPIVSPEEISKAMNLVGDIAKNCQNVGRNTKLGCRCYLVPKEISIF